MTLLVAASIKRKFNVNPPLLKAKLRVIPLGDASLLLYFTTIIFCSKKNHSLNNHQDDSKKLLFALICAEQQLPIEEEQVSSPEPVFAFFVGSNQAFCISTSVHEHSTSNKRGKEHFSNKSLSSSFKPKRAYPMSLLCVKEENGYCKLCPTEFNLAIN